MKNSLNSVWLLTPALNLRSRFNDPDLDSEELDEQAQRLMSELRKHLRIDSSKIPKHFADQSYIDK